MYALLEDYLKRCEDDECRFLIDWTLKRHESIRCRFLKGVKVECGQDSIRLGMKDYHIRACSRYTFGIHSRKTTVQAFSVVLINFNDSVPESSTATLSASSSSAAHTANDIGSTTSKRYVKVLAIVEMLYISTDVQVPINITRTVLIVALLSKVNRPLGYYPYDEYTYSKDNQRLDLHVVPVEAVLAPCFHIASHDPSIKHSERLISGFNKTIYIVPFSRMRNLRSNCSYNDLTLLYPDTFYSVQKINDTADMIATLSEVQPEDDESASGSEDGEESDA